MAETWKWKRRFLPGLWVPDRHRHRPEGPMFWRTDRPQLSPDARPRQSPTYSFRAVHASHLVTTQRHERFKHVVQDLGRQRQTGHHQPSVSADPSLLRAPGPVELERKPKTPGEEIIPAAVWGLGAGEQPGRSENLQRKPGLSHCRLSRATTKPAHSDNPRLHFPGQTQSFIFSYFVAMLGPDCGVAPGASLPVDI